MSARRNKTNFEESLRMNQGTYIQYVNRLTELSISMFEWQNVPDTIDVRFLEYMLFQNGKVVLFKDDVVGFLALPCTIQGKLNVYRYPTKVRAYAVNGYQKKLTIDNSVVMYNNMIRTNSILDVKMFAKRLYNLDRIIDVNTNAQKTPVLIQCSENQRLSMKNLYKEYDGNSPVIFADKNLDINGLKVLRTDAPYMADKLYTLKTQIWNEALTYLGISNVSFQKKERLISDEVSRSMGSTIASRYSRLEARRQACEMFNKMFNENIWVDYREDFREIEDDIVIKTDTENGETGNIVRSISEDNSNE